ncbi:MAG TPA: FAD-binding protein [Gaiellaceae bacterium]|jgi:succinate dehydrogenase / fumarate reductase flavoprotein subunit
MDVSHDVLVIGAGCAGMRAAIEAFDAGADVALVSKIHPTRSHSGAAEGGINAPLGNASEDNPELHAFDTVKGADYLGDQDAIEILCAEAANDVYELENWGAVFSRMEDGRIAQRPFGAAGAPRTAYAADITGHVLIQVLYEQVVKRDIRVYDEYFAWKLVEDGGRCVGVLAWNLLRGGLEALSAKTTILATGGAGRLYVGTTNAYACTGDGMTMALRLGVPLKDMEMMQFHPTTLAPTGVLITEGCRGEGAYLLNSEGDRFLARYAPNAMELASRDVISRAEQTEIDEGRGIDGNVLLDLRHLGAERILEALHGTRELSMVFAGVDPIYDPIPVRPGAHYHMGGIDTDVWGRTELDGLYAAGEVACISVHGANRLGGNALMETITFGRRAGADASDVAHRLPEMRVPESVLRDGEAELAALLDRREGERPWRIRDELAASMHENFGVFRREDQMEEQGRIVEALRERYDRVVVEDKGDVFNSDLTQALELGFLLELGSSMVVAGLARKESRGAHARPYDYPDRDDENFLRHTLIRWENGGPELDWKPVTITKWQPAERVY